MIESKYNFYITLDNFDEQLVYNAISNFSIKADSDTINTIKNPDEKDIKKVVELKEMHFIIDKDFDEKVYLHHIYNISKYRNARLSLTIAPTLDCNFACPYCYEEHEHSYMEQPVIDEVIKIVESNAKQKRSVGISWYGGEPLLAPKTISQLSQEMKSICETNDVSYNAGIITNGYLVEDIGIGFFRDNDIKRAQITLDGPPAIPVEDF
jgi:uncharacterized protein